MPRPEGAFTLLEVLIALAIFAMAAVVLASSYLNILNSYEIVARNMVNDEDIAFARQIVLTEPDRAKLEQGGDFETAGGRRARWSVEITSTSMADLFSVAFTCEISDPARSTPEKSKQTFTVLRPTWSIDLAEQTKLRQEARTRIAEINAKKGQ
ncbi:MAG: prepilin-type N-terminal cleavage/methylation domain-containing protein [Opitutaceae bacterium]